jgi:cytochrome c
VGTTDRMISPSVLTRPVKGRYIVEHSNGREWLVRRLKVVLAGGVVGVLLGGYMTPTWALEPGDPERGKVVYNQYCYKCHGVKGDGNGEVGGVSFPPPANFTDPALWKNRPDSFFIDVITNGYDYGKMPPWWDVISKQEIQDVFAYIKTFRKK